MSVYAPQLATIANQLKVYAAAVGAKLLFGITSPMLADLSADNDVCELNRRAAMVMEQAKVPTINMHDAITNKCGAAPQATCFNQSGCFSPHCGGDGGVGYQWLAETTIVPALTKLLL